MLVSTALVLLMTPALGFFYGGMVRSKNALNTMMMSFVALGPVAVAWALLGYSLAFAPGMPMIGSLAFAGLNGVGLEAQGTIPHLLFMVFQGTFAIITAALISGAVVERFRFQRLPRLHRRVGPARVRAGRALGVGRRVSRGTRCARFRRRRGGARERGGGGAGRRDCRRSAQGLRPPRHPSAQRAVHDARRRACCGSAGSDSTPGARCPPGRLARSPLPTRCWRRRRRWRRGPSSICCAAGGSRRSAQRRPLSSAWSWSRRRPGTSGRRRRSRWARSGRFRAILPCCTGPKRSSTTRSTSSPHTDSVARPGRCSPACSRRRRGAAGPTA